MQIFDFIAYPLGKFLYFIYNTVAFSNYGLAIIIFTVLIRLALLPLTVKQFRSSAKMQAIQPKLQEIQKRYKGDKEKLNQEMMRLYKENNVNPAGGCLPLLIQMPILISLYWDIVQPLKFMLGKTADQITKLVEFVASKTGQTVAQMGFRKEIEVMQYLNAHTEQLGEVSEYIKADELIKMKFLGLDLGMVAKMPWDIPADQLAVYLPLLLLPLFAVVTTFLSAKLSMASSPARQNKPNEKPAGSGMQNSMLYVGPLMTLIFSFSLPAGVVLYWAIGSCVQIAQQLYINKKFLTKGVKPNDDTKPKLSGKKRQIGSGSGRSGS